jgi:translation initiation factor 4E
MADRGPAGERRGDPSAHRYPPPSQSKPFPQKKQRPQSAVVAVDPAAARWGAPSNSSSPFPLASSTVPSSMSASSPSSSLSSSPSPSPSPSNSPSASRSAVRSAAELGPAAAPTDNAPSPQGVLDATVRYIEEAVRHRPRESDRGASATLPTEVAGVHGPGPAADEPLPPALRAPLQNRWVFWYSLNQRDRGATRTDWLSQLIQSSAVTTAGEFAQFSVQLQQRKALLSARVQALMIFREGVKPLWEVPANRRGGKFAVALTNGDQSTLEVYIRTVAAIVTGAVVQEDDVCGVVLSFRPWGGTFTLWNSDSKDEQQLARLISYLKSALGMTHLLYQPHKRSIALNRRKVRSKTSVDSTEPPESKSDGSLDRWDCGHFSQSADAVGAGASGDSHARFSMSMPSVHMRPAAPAEFRGDGVLTTEDDDDPSDSGEFPILMPVQNAQQGSSQQPSCSRQSQAHEQQSSKAENAAVAAAAAAAAADAAAAAADAAAAAAAAAVSRAGSSDNISSGAPVVSAAAPAKAPLSTSSSGSSDLSSSIGISFIAEAYAPRVKWIQFAASILFFTTAAILLYNNGIL